MFLVLLALLCFSGFGQSLVDVFLKGESGYYCIKIPDLVLTMNGSLLAFGEARIDSCSDYAWTDLVYKRSTDQGKTWSKLMVAYTNSTKAVIQVIGNAAPVQDRSTGRIWLPFSRNNSQFFITFSDDDGKTWQSQTSQPKDITKDVSEPGWDWVGSGPPAGIQLTTGRLLVPGYHGPFHWDDGTVTAGFCYYSDDHGKTWQRGGEYGSLLDPLEWVNECQAVDFGNNSIAIFSRGALRARFVTYSNDGGQSFSPTQYANGIWQPLDGCEGSTIRHPKSGVLYYSGVTPSSWTFLRYNMTLHQSTDNGLNWNMIKVIDAGSSAYSAMVVMPDGSISIIYEHSKDLTPIFVPDAISYTTILSVGEQEYFANKKY